MTKAPNQTNGLYRNRKPANAKPKNTVVPWMWPGWLFSPASSVLPAAGTDEAAPKWALTEDDGANRRGHIRGTTQMAKIQLTPPPWRV